MRVARAPESLRQGGTHEHMIEAEAIDVLARSAAIPRILPDVGIPGPPRVGHAESLECHEVVGAVEGITRRIDDGHPGVEVAGQEKRSLHPELDRGAHATPPRVIAVVLEWAVERGDRHVRARDARLDPSIGWHRGGRRVRSFRERPSTGDRHAVLPASQLGRDEVRIAGGTQQTAELNPRPRSKLGQDDDVWRVRGDGRGDAWHPLSPAVLDVPGPGFSLPRSVARKSHPSLQPGAILVRPLPAPLCPLLRRGWGTVTPGQLSLSIQHCRYRVVSVEITIRHD